MASSFKRSYFNPTTIGLDVAYTVPAVTTAIAISALATPTNGKDKTISVGIAPTGATSPNWISRNIEVPDGSSVNLIPEKLALTTGDRVVVNADTDLAQLIQTANSMPIINPKYMAVNTAGTVIVVGGDNGVARSTDGGVTFTITNGVNPTNSGFNLLTFFNSKFIYFASENEIYTSIDGTTWTRVYGQTYPTSSVVGNATKLIGINNGSLYESFDGTTWSSVVSQGLPINIKTGAEVHINAITAGSSYFVAVGNNGTIFHSSGASDIKSWEWSQCVSGITDNLYGVTITSSHVVAVGEKGRIVTASASSFNASTAWTASISSVTSETLRAATWVSSTLVMVGDGGTVVTANASAGSQSLQTSNVTERLNGVSSTGTSVVAVGNNGTIITSSNSGSTWTTRTSGTSEHLYGVVYAGSVTSTWWVCGANGTVKTSSNLSTWTTRTSNTSETLYATCISSNAHTAVLMAGSGGTLLAADAKYLTFSISTIKSGVTADIYGIACSSTYQTCFVGKTGLIGIGASELIYNSLRLSPQIIDFQISSGTAQDLNAVYYSGSETVIVGNNGTILTSDSTLSTWTARTSGTSSHLYAVHKVGSVWVAVGASGAVTVGNSTATTWTNQTPITANNLYGLHTGPSSTGFITVGAGGVIFTGNAAGTTWTSRTNADTQDLYSVVLTNSLFIAVGGSSGTGRVLTGDATAATWTVRTSGVTEILRSVSSPTSSNALAVGDNGTYISSANAGTSWTVQTSGMNVNFKHVLYKNAIASFNNIFNSSFDVVIVGQNGTFLTVNSSSYRPISRSQNSTSQINGFTDISAGVAVSIGPGGKILGYVFTNSGFQETRAFKPTEITAISRLSSGVVAAGLSSTLYASPSSNSHRWNTLTPSTLVDNNFRAITFNGTSAIAVGNNGIAAHLNTTTGTPAYISNCVTTRLNGIVWNGARHIVVGDSGAIYWSTSSTNDLILTKATSGTSNDLNSIAYTSASGGLHVVVGNGGTILTSTGTTGTSWTSQTSGTSEHLLSVTYNSSTGGFIAVGTNGTILTSNSTATTWTTRTSGVDKNLNCVFIGGGVSAFPITVGDAGTLLYANAAGSTWTSVNSGVFHNLKGGVADTTGYNYVVGDGYTILDVSNVLAPIIRSTFDQYFVPKAVTPFGQSIFTANKVYYVGNNGMLAHSGGNAGSTMLIPKFTGTYYNLNDIYAISGSNAVIVGDNGTILGSLNNGLNWFWFNSGVETNFNGVSFGTATWVMVGNGGVVKVIGTGTFTVNSSPTNATSNTTNNLNSVDYNSSGTTWVAVGDNGTIITTATETIGAFTVRTSGTSNNLNYVYSDTGTVHVAVGDGGIILTAPSGGSTWTTRTSNVTTNLNWITLITGTTYAVVGDAGTYLSTTAPTTSWTNVSSGTTNDIYVASSPNGSSVQLIDSVGNLFSKASYNAASTLLNSPMDIIKLAASNDMVFGSKINPIIGATSYSINFFTPGRTVISYNKISPTAITSVTSIGDSSNDVFLICQESGPTYYTSDFSLYFPANIKEKYAYLVENRVIAGETDVINVTQSGALTALPVTNPVSFGPTLSLTTYLSRYGNVVYAINSAGELWKVSDITSNTPRAGLQFVVSVTEFS